MYNGVIMKKVRSNRSLIMINQIVNVTIIILMAYFIDILLVKSIVLDKISLDIYLILLTCVISKIIIFFIKKIYVNKPVFNQICEEFEIESLDEVVQLDEILQHQLKDKPFISNTDKVIMTKDFLIVEQNLERPIVIPVPSIKSYDKEKIKNYNIIKLNIKNREEVVFFKKNKDVNKFCQFFDENKLNYST